MTKFNFLLLIAGFTLLSADPSFSQNSLDMAPLSFETKSAGDFVAKGANEQTRHFTLELMEAPEGKEALRKYHEWKAAGTLPAVRKGQNDPIGTIRDFSVTSAVASAYTDIQFIKRAEGPGFSLWVEVDEINNGHVRDIDIDAIVTAAGVSTPVGSVNPAAGVIANDIDVFGDPMDVDGDGILDILLLDIEDGYPNSTGIVGGFFDPANILGQNQRDIIHLDSYPTLIDINGNRNGYTSPQQVLAHEFQHLIFANVNSFGDATFVNEGLSEFAEVANGFPGRPINYYQQENERLKPLLDFNQTTNAYQRAGLFTSYIAERIGRRETGALSTAIELNHLNYSAVLADYGLNFTEVLLDFHTANLLNDKNVDPAFGYSRAPFSFSRISSIPRISGLSGNSTDPVTLSLQPGAAYYVEWTDVASLQIDITGDFSKLDGHLVLKTYDDLTTVIPLDESDEGVFLGDDFASVVLVLTNTVFEPATFTQFELKSSWTTAQSQFIVEETIYDTGRIQFVDGLPLAILLELDRITANRFEVPPGASLSSVSVDHAYQAEFPNSTLPPDSPRDFTLMIWDENAEGNPGNLLFSIAVDDLSPLGAFTVFDPMVVALDAYAEQIGALPDVIFVGVGAAGPDFNLLVMTASEFNGAVSPSRFYTGTEWRKFQDLVTSTNISFASSVLPIRARFVTPAEPVATDAVAEIPEQISLHQNYPNPFNPATTIEFNLPDANIVRLTVYDILGREIAVLVDEFRTVGVHQVSFDASRFASGLYLYALEAGDTKITRTMTLLK